MLNEIHKFAIILNINQLLMKVIFFIACLFTFVFSFGQKKITFKIENLSKPKNLLITEDVDNIYMRLISDNYRNVNYLEDADSINKSPYNII